MRRARNAPNLYLLGILDTTVLGVYKLTEMDITYELTYEQFNRLKASKAYTVEEWYNKLDRFERKELKRYGNTKVDNNGFYPDIE